MKIEITKPETAALVQRCLQTGQFEDFDELLTKALSALQEKEGAANGPLPAHPDKSLVTCLNPSKAWRMTLTSAAIDPPDVR